MCVGLCSKSITGVNFTGPVAISCEVDIGLLYSHIIQQVSISPHGDSNSELPTSPVCAAGPEIRKIT